MKIKNSKITKQEKGGTYFVVDPDLDSFRKAAGHMSISFTHTYMQSERGYVNH